jgi:hypothetical protein
MEHTTINEVTWEEKDWLAGRWWLTHVILAAQEAQIRKIMV